MQEPEFLLLMSETDPPPTANSDQNCNTVYVYCMIYGYNWAQQRDMTYLLDKKEKHLPFLFLQPQQCSVTDLFM